MEVEELLLQLSFGLVESDKDSASLLDSVIGSEVKSLDIGVANWEEFLIGLRYDPCRLLFRRLLDTAETGQAVDLLTDGTIGGRVLMRTPDRLRLSIELSRSGMLKVLLGFDPDQIHIATRMTAKLAIFNCVGNQQTVSQEAVAP